MPSATYALFVSAVEDYLRSTGSIDRQKSKSNKQIINYVRGKILSKELAIDMTDGSMLSYLSNAANQDDTNGIESGGPRAGYWLQSDAQVEVEAKPEDKAKITAAKGKSVVVREKDLYPLLELWLNQKGYKAKDTSDLKSGGRWGNPDIVGADRVEIFGAVEIDLASCEIKLAEDGWEQVIFEAISHKRFANRSWFCYRVDADDVPLAKGMDYYAERYRVGLVQIILSDAELLSLKSKTKEPLDFIERVVERIPALYDYVPLREQRELIERTGISLSLTI